MEIEDYQYIEGETEEEDYHHVEEETEAEVEDEVIDYDAPEYVCEEFWEQEFPEIVFVAIGFPSEPLSEEYYDEGYVKSSYHYKDGGVYQKPDRTDREMLSKILVFYDELYAEMEKRDCPYKSGKSDDEMIIKKEDFPDHPCLVERSGSTSSYVLLRLYMALLEQLECGHSRLPVWGAEVDPVRGLIDSMNAGSKYMRDGKVFGDQYKYVMRDSDTKPLYGHMDGEVESDTTPDQEIYYIECISKIEEKKAVEQKKEEEMEKATAAADACADAFLAELDEEDAKGIRRNNPKKKEFQNKYKQ